MKVGDDRQASPESPDSPDSPKSDGNDFVPEKSPESDEAFDVDFGAPRKRQRTVPAAKSVPKGASASPAGKEESSKYTFQGIEHYLNKSPLSQRWHIPQSSGPTLLAPQQRHLLTVPTFRPQTSQQIPNPPIVSHSTTHTQLLPRPSAAQISLQYPSLLRPDAPQASAAANGGLAFKPQGKPDTLTGQSPTGLSQLVSISNDRVAQQQQEKPGLSANAAVPSELILRGFNFDDRATFLKVCALALIV